MIGAAMTPPTAATDPPAATRPASPIQAPPTIIPPPTRLAPPLVTLPAVTMAGSCSVSMLANMNAPPATLNAPPAPANHRVDVAIPGAATPGSGTSGAFAVVPGGKPRVPPEY